MKGNLKEYLKTYQLKENETIKNGMLYCSLCGGKKIYLHKKNEFYHCICTCQNNAYLQQEEQIRKEKRFRFIQNLKNDSLLYKKYENLNFEKLDYDRPESITKAFNYCKEYCENLHTNIAEGKGLYLYGEDTGTGKTIASVCIANYALEHLVPTLFTSFFEIMKTIKAIYDKQSKLSEDE